MEYPRFADKRQRTEVTGVRGSKKIISLIWNPPKYMTIKAMMQPEVASSDQQTASGGHVVIVLYGSPDFPPQMPQQIKFKSLLAGGLDSWETNVGSGSEIVRM